MVAVKIFPKGDESSINKGLSGGEIAGIVISVLIVVCTAAAVAILFFLKRRRDLKIFEEGNSENLELNAIPALNEDDVAVRIDPQDQRAKFRQEKKALPPQPEQQPLGYTYAHDRTFDKYLFVPPNQEVLVNVGPFEQATCRPVLVMEVLDRHSEEKKQEQPVEGTFE